MKNTNCEEVSKYYSYIVLESKNKVNLG